MFQQHKKKLSNTSAPPPSAHLTSHATLPNGHSYNAPKTHDPHFNSLFKLTSMEKGKKACTLLLGALRLMSMAATLSATIVTITSRERVIVFNFTVDAKYHYTPSLKFFAIANGIGSVYSLVVLFIPATKFRRLVVAFDVVITMLLTASASAALAVGHVARKGDSHAGWIPICGQVPKFCDHVMAALILGFCGVFIYMFLLLHAIHTFIKPILL